MILFFLFLVGVFSRDRFSRRLEFTPQLVYEWTKLDYEWNNDNQKNGFVVENNCLTGSIIHTFYDYCLIFYDY